MAKKSKFSEWSDEQKIQLVREIMMMVSSGEANMNRACRSKDISTTTVNQWKKKYANHIEDLVQADKEKKERERQEKILGHSIPASKPGVIFDYALYGEPLVHSGALSFFQTWDRIRSHRCNLVEVGRLHNAFNVYQIVVAVHLAVGSAKVTTPAQVIGTPAITPPEFLPQAAEILQQIATDGVIMVERQDRKILEESLLTMGGGDLEQMQKDLEASNLNIPIEEMTKLDPLVCLPEGAPSLPNLRAVSTFKVPLHFQPNQDIRVLAKFPYSSDGLDFVDNEGITREVLAYWSVALRGEILITPVPG
jgi:hypothetical protein